MLRPRGGARLGLRCSLLAAVGRAGLTRGAAPYLPDGVKAADDTHFQRDSRPCALTEIRDDSRADAPPPPAPAQTAPGSPHLHPALAGRTGATTEAQGTWRAASAPEGKDSALPTMLVAAYSPPRGMVRLRTSVREPGSLVTWGNCFAGIHSSVTLDFSRHEGVIDPDMRITWPRGGRPRTAVELLLSRSRRATRGPEVLASLGRPLSQSAWECRWPASRGSPSIAVGAGLALLCSAEPRGHGGSGPFQQHWVVCVGMRSLAAPSRLRTGATPSVGAPSVLLGSHSDPPAVLLYNCYYAIIAYSCLRAQPATGGERPEVGCGRHWAGSHPGRFLGGGETGEGQSCRGARAGTGGTCVRRWPPRPPASSSPVEVLQDSPRVSSQHVTLRGCALERPGLEADAPSVEDEELGSPGRVG
uniref:Uncharacterized protein n=1 Tax=Rangifer tarandus platyrhynchus TaxID=3082113 RepID=A0ACB0EFV7_RANTA|nr:unnamed protein product [Rangifer tarandus platyrhynchus]